MSKFERPTAQVGALCYRKNRDGKTEILLVTSRDTGRWIIPKGWPIDGKPDPQAAEQEAWEEAGVREGNVKKKPVGTYEYPKVLDCGGVLPCEVSVYPLKVEETEMDFPEADERTRKWVSPAEAAKLVDEPELKDILREF